MADKQIPCEENRLLNEVLSITAQELVSPTWSRMLSSILNEVLSITAQELLNATSALLVFSSSMKS